MISVVVCTFNRCRTLDRMLHSYFDQEGLDSIDHELIVVDNNSDDDTRPTALKYSGAPWFRYVHEPRQGLSAARNRGIEESHGDILAFLDDDVLVSPHWLQHLVQCYRETSATVVGGRANLLLEDERPSWFGPIFQSLLSEVDFGPQRREIPTGVGLWGVNLSFKKAALEGVGGFDERLGRRGAQLLGGEEMAVLERLASQPARIVYEPAACVLHIIGKERLTWEYFVRLAHANGATKQAHETDRGCLWQVFRVLRSLIRVSGQVGLLAIGFILRRDHYTVRSMRWNAVFETTYFALRCKRLVDLCTTAIRTTVKAD